MRLGSLNLVDYRNVELARLQFQGRRIFFLGPNGQGKTNVLESIGLSSALRSFRTMETRDLIRWERPRAELLFRFEDENVGNAEILISLDRSKGKAVAVDGNKLSRLGDFIGRFPSVIFSSDDLRLPRGSPGERRKFLDLVFSSSSVEYLEELRRYHRALRGRNALLRMDGDEAELAAFEKEMSLAGVFLSRKRKQEVASLAEKFACRYRAIGGEGECPALRYLPDLEIETADDFARALRDGRERDRQVKNTQKGLHRDDWAFLLNERDARKFASEGQQRSIVLALRFGQVDYLRERCQASPLILIDDVLGELDAERRANFRSCLDDASQVFATGTQLLDDDSDDWAIFQTSEGRFLKL